jgi:Tol biopolymer transport system component
MQVAISRPLLTPEIAFVSNRGGNFDLYTMRADGSGVRRLTDDPSADVAPAWSPNGKQIAFLSQRGLAKTLRNEGASGSLSSRLAEGEPGFSRVRQPSTAGQLGRLTVA